MYKDVYTITKKIKDKKYYSNQGVFWLNTFSWLKLKKTMDNHYSPRKIEGMDVFSPKKDNFKGKLYILINGKSFSATGEFTSFLKNNRNVIFIGEEVGGNKVQNTSGISYIITLPYSKQKVKIPLVVWEMNVDYKNDSHGIKPDYWIRNTIGQELNDYDSVLNFTLEFIKNR
jgi:C-terminal processing protease CtpA/Prc